MLSGSGKILLMLSGNGSGWARVEYRDFAGNIRLSIQGVSEGSYAVGFCAGRSPVLNLGLVSVGGSGKGTAVLDFGFRDMNSCHSLGLLITDGKTELSAVKGIDRIGDIRYALRQKKPKEAVKAREAPKSEKPHRRYYDTVRDYFEGMFADYDPSKDNLAARMPYSRWKRVDYNETGGYCMVGLVYNPENESTVDYICYGIPGKAASGLNPTLAIYCQFIPDETGENGWWLMYQDAETGETVTV